MRNCRPSTAKSSSRLGCTRLRTLYPKIMQRMGPRSPVRAKQCNTGARPCSVGKASALSLRLGLSKRVHLKASRHGKGLEEHEKGQGKGEGDKLCALASLTSGPSLPSLTMALIFSIRGRVS
eukprot:328557-Pyramimonas_sp.AAC.1